MNGILNGIRVLDLSRYIAGPYCGVLLADMGAEVIKVEKLNGGDETRTLGPWKDGTSLYFPGYNRNKKSVTVNFRTPEGIALIKKLVDTADVVLENFRTGTMKKMGLDYESLKEINPKIIMVSVTGFGQTGPCSTKAAFDNIISAMSGVARTTPRGIATGRGAMHDFMAAMYAAYGIALALYERNQTGKGQYIDVGMYASSAMLRSVAIADYAMNGEFAFEDKDDSAPYGYIPTKDGWLAFHAGTDPMYSRLLTVIDDPILHDPKYQDVVVRVEECDTLVQVVAKWASDKTSTEIEKIFDAAQIPVGAVATPKTLLNSAHLRETGHIVNVPINGLGEVPFCGFPFTMSEHQQIEYRKAPDLGENNEEIYEELGLSKKEITELRRKKII